MKCRDVQRILLASRPDELDPALATSVEDHCARCGECRELRDAVMNSDRLIEDAKTSVPILRNETEFTDSVMASLDAHANGAARTARRSFIDRLVPVFTLRSVRIACSALIACCLAWYLYLESSDMGQILRLERTIGNSAGLTRANVPIVRDETLRRLYNAYRVSAGDLPVAEISDELVLISRKDLQLLLSESEMLNRLAGDYRAGTADTSGALRDPEALKKEIDRLKNELDRQSRQRSVR